MMARSKGQGSIVPGRPTPTGQKRWIVAVTMADGRRVYRAARSPREAERIRAQLVEARELDLDPTRQTVAGYLRSWIGGLRDARHQRVRPRTLQHYEMIVERHIIPTLGHLRLSQLTVPKVQAWIDADAASARSVHHHRAVLRLALNRAVRHRLIAYNPAALVEVPDVEPDKSDPLSVAEVRALLEATEGDRLHALWRLALASGLRLGELLGLAWEDIDLGRLRGVDGDGEGSGPRSAGRTGGAGDDERVAADGARGHLHGDRRDVAGRRADGIPVAASVTVRAQLQRLPPDRGGDANGWARTPTKAARALETIHIGEGTAAVLAAHRTRQAAERKPDWRYFGLVFVTERGDPYHPSFVLTSFRKACAAAGIRRRRVHDLRHSSAALMKAEGIPEDVRMARLGHSTTAMARRYGGASDATDRLASDALDRAMGG